MAKLPHILVVPFPLQSHVTGLMEFSHKLLDHGFRITFVNVESMHQKILSTLVDHNVERKGSAIHFVSIPDGLVFDDSQNFTHYMSDTMPSYLEELITRINESEDDNIDCVVADGTVGRILEVAEKFGIKRAAFWPTSLCFLAFMHHFPKLVDAGDVDNNGDQMKGKVIRLPPSMPATSSLDYMWSFSNDMNARKITLAIIEYVNRAITAANWILSSSFYDLEPASHDFIPNILSVGPFISREPLDHPIVQFVPEDSTCLSWLDQQPVQSVLYVAFGSFTLFNHGQFTELLHGLELSNRPFLCVVRPGFTDDLATSLLDSFKVRNAHCGKVVDWAPQKKVLAHPSVACFITHCGWNSILESISMGVPLLCSPNFGDHFHIENYICDIWKVGLRLNKDERAIITRTEIKKKVNELLTNVGIQSRVNKLKEMANRSVSEGGISSNNLEQFINMIKG